MDIGHVTWLERVYCSKIEKQKIDDIWLTLLQAKLLHTILQTRSNWNSTSSESSQFTVVRQVRSLGNKVSVTAGTDVYGHRWSGSTSEAEWMGKDVGSHQWQTFLPQSSNECNSVGATYRSWCNVCGICAACRNCSDTFQPGVFSAAICSASSK